ncbi:MAG: peptidase C39 family protein [Streptosporangiales bacterium]|nr:peptidase C39 family protein [Streptosporangiales bacterium]
MTATALVAATTLLWPGATAPAAAKESAEPRHVSYREWSDADAFAAGRSDGVQVQPGGRLALGDGAGETSYTDPFGDGNAKKYRTGTWTSPTHEHEPGFGTTEAVASWNADTPTGTWIEVGFRGQVTGSGRWTKWYTMGRWTSGDDFAAGDIHRTSVPSQGDDDGYVAVDTFVAAKKNDVDGVQLRVRLHAPAGSDATPKVSKASVLTSLLPDGKKVPTSDFTLGREIDLEVPGFSQNIHEGHYPEYDNGGEAWCSPTSTTMALYHWDRTVPAGDTDWVEPKPHQGPQVDYAARNTYDYDYEGAGNWSFNTAYAAEFDQMEGFVTRLRSLAEAERFIERGIPLVVSVSFDEKDMDGAGYSTTGHLFVIAGFTEDGDVIVNDPATREGDEVPRVYRRDQVENAWLPHSGGLTYVLHPSDVELPPTTTADEPNW